MIISQVGSFSFQLHLPKTTHKCRKCDFPDQSDFPLLCRDMSLKPLYSQSIFNVNNAIGGQLECMKESTFIRESWIQVRNLLLFRASFFLLFSLLVFFLSFLFFTSQPVAMISWSPTTNSTFIRWEHFLQKFSTFEERVIEH